MYINNKKKHIDHLKWSFFLISWGIWTPQCFGLSLQMPGDGIVTKAQVMHIPQVKITLLHR